MATHSSILAWRIPWTESDGLQSKELQESEMTEQLTHTHTPHINSLEEHSSIT